VTTPQEEVQQQAGKVLSQVAGFVGTRTIQIGLQAGLFEALAEGPKTSDQLASAKGIDELYSMVWCRSAFANELLEKDGDKYKLAPHMDKLLLEEDLPGFIGGMVMTVTQPEVFDSFAAKLQSGERLWWDTCGPDFIKSVSLTGRPFYNRMITAGFSQVPGLTERLESGARLLELGSGAGVGLVKLATAYPNVSLVGVDGDAYSLDLLKERLAAEGVKAELVHSTLEDFDMDSQFDVAFINITMHECRDLDKVTQNVHKALKPEGVFVISDMPFPESDEACRTVPARIMSGIQFFEGQIDDQLLPTKAYADLLTKHGFSNVGSFDITPVHMVVYGQKLAA
jgi:SAM-dependent methyltransferase